MPDTPECRDALAATRLTLWKARESGVLDGIAAVEFAVGRMSQRNVKPPTYVTDALDYLIKTADKLAAALAEEPHDA